MNGRVLARTLLLVAVAGWHSEAQAQAPAPAPTPVCSAELRALQDVRQQMRSEVIAGNTTTAIATASKQKLETPAGYDYENSTACQKWALEVANVHRASCSFDLARKQLQSIHTEQALAADAVRNALDRASHQAVVPFRCKDKKKLYLLCQPVSDAVPDAWCARSIERDQTLEFPRDAWCKVIDEEGAEVSSVSEGSEPTCREDLNVQKRSDDTRLRAERRAAVAGAGTGIAFMAAAAVPLSFVPEGFAKLLRKLGALDKHGGERLRHHSFRARQRVLPLIGVNALAVSALSSRFWWAGILTTGCGVTADVMLAQNWHHHDKVKRSIGIAAATLGATGGLVLDLETLGYSDMGARYSFMPTLRFGVADAEFGLAGRF